MRRQGTASGLFPAGALRDGLQLSGVRAIPAATRRPPSGGLFVRNRSASAGPVDNLPSPFSCGVTDAGGVLSTGDISHPHGREPMRITLVGSRHFGVTTLQHAAPTWGRHRQGRGGRRRGPPGDGSPQRRDRGRRAGQSEARRGPEIAGTDLIVTAHSHARISKEALAAARLGGIGYHPSLLPRHRGIAAVEWTIKEGDPIAGGTDLSSRRPHGRRRDRRARIGVRQEGETARVVGSARWLPLGQKLLGEVIDYAKAHVGPARRNHRTSSSRPTRLV